MAGTVAVRFHDPGVSDPGSATMLDHRSFLDLIACQRSGAGLWLEIDVAFIIIISCWLRWGTPSCSTVKQRSTMPADSD